MKPFRACIAVLGVATALGAFAQAQGSIRTGTPAAVADGQRTITIGPDTKHVNVNEGETVKFVAGNAVFAWRFDGRYSTPFNLQDVAPSGALANPVKVYVKRRIENNR